MNQLPTPEVGTVITCQQENIKFLGSNVPSVRITSVDGSWVVSTDPKRGLLVYIVEPKHIALNKIETIAIVSVGSNVAHAEVVFRDSRN